MISEAGEDLDAPWDGGIGLGGSVKGMIGEWC